MSERQVSQRGDGRAAPLALVIARDSDVAQCMAARLKAEGYDVITATSTRDGLRLAVDEIPTAVVLEVDMPEIDGPAAVRWLRQQSETRNMAVVFVTDGTSSDEKARRFNVHRVSKPFKPGQLIVFCLSRDLIFSARVFQ